MTKRRILVADLAAQAPVWTLPGWAAEELRRSAPPDWEVRIVSAPTTSDADGADTASAEALSAVAGAEVYFGFGVSRAIFKAAASTVKWIHSAAAGVRGALFPELMQSDVLLTNSAGVHAVPISEYVVGGVLHLLRGFDIAIEQQRRSAWEREPFVGERSPVRELAECTVLVIGTGGLGREIAARMSAFGAKCTGVRRRPELGAPQGFERVVSQSGLDTELPKSDVVVLAAPLTSATEGLLDDRRLGLLQRHAIVVNVARGALVDENALASRIASGGLRGAVLDVFGREPLASDSALWQLRSVLLTPHVSAVSSRGFWRRELDLFLDNWRRYISGADGAGASLRNLVDRQAGY